MLVGRICWWWFCSTEVKRSTLCFMLVYALSALLKLACKDSAPCSPIQPNPTFHCFSHGMTWSSNMCIFGRIVAEGRNSSSYSEIYRYAHLVKNTFKTRITKVMYHYPKWWFDLMIIVNYYWISCGTQTKVVNFCAISSAII